MIEGDYSTGSNVVVVEDLISTGGSSLKAVEALRAAGLNVKGVIAIFSYGFETATKAFEEANCQLNVLSNYEVMIKIALKQDTITETDMESLREWRISPDTWGK